LLIYSEKQNNWQK